MNLSGISDNIDSLVEETVKAFDFARACVLMLFANMYWLDSDDKKYLPSQEELKEKAADLLSEACSDCIEAGVSEIAYGGLKASAFIDVDGIHLTLEFTILSSNYPEGNIKRMVPSFFRKKASTKDIKKFIELSEKMKLLYLLTKYGDIREHPESSGTFGGKNIL